MSNSNDLNTFYLKLKHGLDGYYVKFRAPSSEYVAAYADYYFGPIGSPTCIYTEAYFYEVVRKREQKTRIIRRNDPIILPMK